MTPKFTPGPWNVLRGHSGYTWYVIFKTRKDENGKITQRTEAAHVYKGPQLVSSHGVEAEALASIDSIGINHNQNKTQNEVEAEANARLIATAPEMYECLKTAAAYNKAMPSPVERAIFADTLMKLFEKIERG